MKHSAITKKKIIISAVCFLAGALVLVSAVLLTLPQKTQSRFIGENSAAADETIEEFYAAAKLYETVDGVRKELPVSVDENGKQYYDISADDFEHLSMDVFYSGKAKTYVRVCVETCWYRQDTDHQQLILHEYPVFAFNDEANIYDNMSIDDCIYFKDIFGSEDTEEKQINVISSVTDSGNDIDDPVHAGEHSERVRLFLTVDCVQFNRAKEVWKLDRFPWES